MRPMFDCRRSIMKKERDDNMKKSGNKKGFTLVEIIVVLLVIGILLAITIPSIMGYVKKAKQAQLIAEARTVYVEAERVCYEFLERSYDVDKTNSQKGLIRITEESINEF